MRTVQLIKEIEHSYKFQEYKDGSLNGNSYTFDTISLEKDVYEASEIVELTKQIEEVALRVQESFKTTFEERGGATEEQLKFALETARVVFGQLKEDVITVIPAPCGFGKSSITIEILKELIEGYKKEVATDGIIIVTDRLESLREIEQNLEQLDLGGFSYLLESWNEEVCINKGVKSSDAKMCTPKKCAYYRKCKLSKQQTEQLNYPILLLTNARLKECGNTIKTYQKYAKGTRTTLLIDERPEVLDTIKVNRELLNKISTAISQCDYISVEDKTTLEKKFTQISQRIEGKMQELRQQHKRLIVSNINDECICKRDDEFLTLWNKYMKKEFRRELEHMHTILTKGGFYVYESKSEFISTIGSRNLRSEYSSTYKTIIFDGTALYDPLYIGMYSAKDLLFLDVENTRRYSNVQINAYMQHKVTKSKFKDQPYLLKACAKFIEKKTRNLEKAYVVTYKDKAVALNDLLGSTSKIPRFSDTETFYFGNTKGTNKASECTKMFQIGWETLPDYEYVIQWLSTTVKWDGVLALASDMEKAKALSSELELQDRSRFEGKQGVYKSHYKAYEYGLSGINQFKNFDTVTRFYQEVHRTKLREYNCRDKITVHIFSHKTLIYYMIKELLKGCTLEIVKDSVKEFDTTKSESRKNKVQGYDAFVQWHEAWDGALVKVKDIKQKCELNDEQWKTLIKNKTIKNMLEQLKKPKKGYYSK